MRVVLSWQVATAAQAFFLTMRSGTAGPIAKSQGTLWCGGANMAIWVRGLLGGGRGGGGGGHGVCQAHVFGSQHSAQQKHAFQSSSSCRDAVVLADKARATFAPQDLHRVICLSRWIATSRGEVRMFA
jgi:hypothetical protein